MDNSAERCGGAMYGTDGPPQGGGGRDQGDGRRRRRRCCRGNGTGEGQRKE